MFVRLLAGASNQRLGGDKMNENVLILSANKYDFTDDRTNRKLTGLTVWVLPYNSRVNDNMNGVKPVKYSLPAEKMHVLDGVNLPAYAKMNFTFDFTSSKIIPDTFTDIVEFNVGELA